MYSKSKYFTCEKRYTCISYYNYNDPLTLYYTCSCVYYYVDCSPSLITYQLYQSPYYKHCIRASYRTKIPLKIIANKHTRTHTHNIINGPGNMSRTEKNDATRYF